MRAVICGHCGHPNAPGTAFCDECHHFLAWSPGDEEEQDGVSAGTGDDAVPDEASGSPVAPSATEADAVIEVGRGLAADRGRDDLASHLAEAQERLAGATFPVVVCGQFKCGKSTLVNALLDLSVCPVDADIVTAVPTTVTYADTPRIVSYVLAEDGRRSYEREIGVDELPGLVTEQADPADPERLRQVEVGVPHPRLRGGLSLVDTPGVGGLDSAHGFLTLSALRFARGTLFVTDASQELNKPELDFLVNAVNRCPSTTLVVTKIDLYPEWRRIVELDRGHLERAGLDIPVLPVSSLLQLAGYEAERGAQAHDPARPTAGDHQELFDESGFAGLFGFLEAEIAERGSADLVDRAAQEVDFVAAQLERQTEVEQAVIARPEAAPQLISELGRATEKARRLSAPNASWDVVLQDGIQDLYAEVEHDLQLRLRRVLRDAEEVIDQGDPKTAWTDIEAWLRREIAVMVMGNRDHLTELAESLASSVAEQFELDASSVFRLEILDEDQTGRDVALAPATTLSIPGGKLQPMIAAARSSYYVPMMVTSVVANFLIAPWMPVAVGVSWLLGAGIGSKIIKDERRRLLEYRRQQAKAAVRRFLDDVAVLVNKQSRDRLVQARRQLRDDFQSRAQQIHRSSAEALAAARRAEELSATERNERRRQLTREQQQLQQVRATTRELAGRAA